MPSPLQIRSLRAVKTRLNAILQADGYLTDAGNAVYFGPRIHSKKACPAINVIDAGDEPTSGGAGNSRSMAIRQTVYVDCFAVMYEDDEESGIAVGELRADAKQALLKYDEQYLSDDDGTLGHLVYAGAVLIDGPENSDVESMRLTFYIDDKEGFGDPYASR